ncbi:uncharacterized protein [Procambarus clarkii]|uniref:uncharacterized protein n=1 Tax=Procambarus clarkii TaxID=6728 RepID=UPI001E67518A|nr:uncharacterized protein LOC123775284 [Procambarus clarkii]XP_045626257.1 uncharacterized protein LOC123775284 [Procambarus clarkii]
MESSVNYGDLNESKMELLLESDEEDASLLKEMEQQDDMHPTKPSITENLLQLKSICPDSPEDYEITEFPEIHEDASGDFVGAIEVSDEKRQRNFIGAFSNNSGTVTYKEEKQVDELQESIEGEKKHKKCLVGGHCDSFTCSGTQQNKILPLTEYMIDGVQILRLDMSTSQLLFAKSAAAMGSQPCKAKSANCLSNASQSKGLSFMELITEERIGNTLSKDYKSSHSNSNEERTKKKSKFIIKMQQDSCVTQPSGNQNKTKSGIKNRKRKNQEVCKQKSENMELNTPVKKKRLAHFNMNGPRVVIFHCSYCDFKCPFMNENINEIVEHLTPRERFNHLHDISEKLNSFKECVKLNVMVAKNKAKVQVRLLSRAECTNCGQQVPLDVDSSDQLALHYNWCRKLISDDKYISCPYCNELVHRGSIKKHLNVKSKKQCTMNITSTLQLMSCVCKQYSVEHRPVCVVCNEKCWSYLGHRMELNPVCEGCRINIISGNTTKLKNRDLAACAICSYQCSKKCVTYWASELEAVFIGENCIKKLKEPLIHKSISVADAMEAKIRKLIEMAVASEQFSMDLERAQAKNISTSVECLTESHTSNSDKYSSNFTNTVQEAKDKKNVMNCNFSQSESEKSMVKHDLPVPSRVTNGHFIPITGSFRINAGNPLPFAKLATTSDTQNPHKTVPVTSISAPAVPKSKVVIQSDVSKNFLKADYTGICQKIAEGKLSMKVSPHRPNPKTMCQVISNCTPNNVITEPLPLKYVLKLNSLTPTRQEKKDDQKEANASHIIIRTSSNAFQIKRSDVAPPRVALVIKTANNLLMNEIKKKGKFHKSGMKESYVKK